jgi:hypothetical protein
MMQVREIRSMPITTTSVTERALLVLADRIAELEAQPSAEQRDAQEWIDQYAALYADDPIRGMRQAWCGGWLRGRSDTRAALEASDD